MALRRASSGPSMKLIPLLNLCWSHLHCCSWSNHFRQRFDAPFTSSSTCCACRQLNSDTAMRTSSELFASWCASGTYSPLWYARVFSHMELNFGTGGPFGLTPSFIMLSYWVLMRSIANLVPWNPRASTAQGSVFGTPWFSASKYSLYVIVPAVMAFGTASYPYAYLPDPMASSMAGVSGAPDFSGNARPMAAADIVQLTACAP